MRSVKAVHELLVYSTGISSLTFVLKLEMKRSRYKSTTGLTEQKMVVEVQGRRDGSKANYIASKWGMPE